MFSFLKVLLVSLLGNSIARMLTGAGLAVVSYAAIAPLILSALNQAASGINGIGGDMLQVCNLWGFGQAVSIIGSAMMTRGVIKAGTMGLTKAASA
jgi:hypothetical protein